MKLLKFTYKKVMSTNDVAIRKIRSGIEQGIIITNEQKKGRGRFGNKWISLKGNLFTTIFYKVNSNYNLKKITQKNCLLIFKTLKTVIKKNISIKYPNDILINSKKICGILQEIIKYNNKHFIILLVSNLNILFEHHHLLVKYLKILKLHLFFLGLE